METRDFEFLRDMLQKESGLVVTPEKMYLLESRLLPIANKYEVKNLDGLVDKLRVGNDNKLKYEIVEAMTTNETSFFRDSTPYDRLKESVIPYMLKNRTNKNLRIWSAACSSGQEPYSISMILKEDHRFADWKIDLIATDLSKDILDQAKEGLYTQFEVQRGLPIQMLVKYFTQEGDKWRIKDEIKKTVLFKEANLLRDIRTMGHFDIIFCRNVLIYFDTEDKAKVFSDLKSILEQDGVLFLGGAETVIGVSEDFKPLPSLKGVYVRNDTSFEPVS